MAYDLAEKGFSTSGNETGKPSSEERIVSRKAETLGCRDIKTISEITKAQRIEIELSFPHLAKVLFDDETKPSQNGGILGSQEEWDKKSYGREALKVLALSRHDAECVMQEVHPEAYNAPVLTDEETDFFAVQGYRHALDILRYEPGEDPDAFEENVKDRRRANPIAKQPARRLLTLLGEAKRMFPNDFSNNRLAENDDVTVHPQAHPTIILPPQNPKLEDELLQKLGTMQKQQK